MNVLPLMWYQICYLMAFIPCVVQSFVTCFALIAYFVLTVPFLSMRHDEVACMDVMYNP